VNGNAEGPKNLFLGRRFTPSFRLTHAAKDHPFVANNGGIPNIYGIQADLHVLREEVEIRTRPREFLHESVILLHGTGKIRTFPVVEPPPLPMDFIIADESIPGMFQQECPDRAHIRLIGPSQKNAPLTAPQRIP
jgi:hypothetical protein